MSTGTLPVLDLPNPKAGSVAYNAVPAWARPKSPTPSVKSRSSGASSPSSSDEDVGSVYALSAGCQPDETYKLLMPAWRYTLRKHLVRSLGWETPRLSSLQKATRAPFWDTYFIWSSIFGTHSAFMVGLPIFWWFGYPSAGRGMVNVLAAGVYLSSFAKDLLCVPRPYNPPVERLSISSHGLEYGFPSTHSTNAVSISLYLAELFHNRASGEPIALAALVYLLCAIYAVSVVAGRLYCGMHSIMDCTAGTLLGVAIWYSNLLITPYFEDFLKKRSSQVPAIIIPLGLFLVSVHPEPVDDCPCFEDAIAFVAVAAGIAIGQWHQNRTGGYEYTGMQGALGFEHPSESAVFVLLVVAKLVFGVGCILLWRVVAKRTLLMVLPPVFKLVKPVFDLPRRFYVQGRGYKEIEESHPLQPVPSVLDLTELTSGINHNEKLESRESSKHLEVLGTASLHPDLRRRKQHSKEGQSSKSSGMSDVPGNIKNGGAGHARVKQLHTIHYDVDVLTKVGVYSGIGVIATTTTPWLFRCFGLDI